MIVSGLPSVVVYCPDREGAVKRKEKRVSRTEGGAENNQVGGDSSSSAARLFLADVVVVVSGSKARMP